MRRTAARGATSAGILPAAFVVALLVGAPFAGTTTTPLIANRAAVTVAPAGHERAAPGSSLLAAAGVRISGRDSAARGMPAVASGPGVARGSLVVLVAFWLALALVGFGVLYAVARRVDARARAQAPGSASGTSSSP